MNEERDERLFAKMEQQVSRAEIQLKGLNDRDRQWFQTMKQRRDERERLTNNFAANEKAAKDPLNATKNDRLSKLSDSKRKKLADADKKKSPAQLAKKKYKKSLETGSLLRAKAAKVQKRPQKLWSIEDTDVKRREVRKPKTSKFAQGLTDTSRKGAKRLRWDYRISVTADPDGEKEFID